MTGPHGIRRAWGAVLLCLLALVVPLAHAATPTFDATCSSSGTGCHVTPPEGGRLNASYSSAFIAKAIADNYGPGMNTLSGTSAATLSAIATELGNYFAVSPQAALVPFQTPTLISLVGKVELGSFYAALNQINVSITPVNGAATPVNTAGAEGINYTPPSCATGARTFTYNATSSTSGQVTSTRTINVSIGNPTSPPAFSSPATSMSATNGVASSAVSFNATICNSIVTYTVSAGSLPTGMSLSPGGTISGTPLTSNVAGAYPITVHAAYPGGQSTNLPFTVNLAYGTPDLSGSAATATGLEGTAITNYQIVATDGATFTYSATGLPPGLLINTSTGVISGTPTVTTNTPASTVYPVVIGANNGTFGNTRTVNFTINGKPAVNSPATASGQTLVTFNYQITGTHTPTTYSATGLPPGLTLTAGGLITGQPTATGPFTTTVTASNAFGASAPFDVAITITQGPPVINALTPQSGSEGQSFSYQVTAQNSPTNFSATNLPAGLSISATGLISGTISAGAAANPSNPYNVAVTATNAAGTDTKNFTLSISVIAPVVTSGASASGQTGVPFSYQITAANIPTSFAAGCPTTASSLPPGLTLNTSTGAISGTPTALGTSTCQVTASNGSGTSPAAPLTITIGLGPPVITSGPTASGAAGFPLTYQITATNSPTSFNATGLPPGMTVSTSTGLVSGTPTTNGTFTATVSAGNGTATVSKTVTFTIAFGLPSVTSPATVTAATGAPFTYQITATNSPTSYAAFNLPQGLSVDATTGLITGQVANFGVYDFTVQASNATGSATRQVALTVSQSAPGMTSGTSATGTIGQPFTFQVSATNGPVRVDATGLPPGLTIDPASGLISGTPTAGGTYPVTLTIANTRGTVTASLTITIPFKLPTVQDVTQDVVYETPTVIALPVAGQGATVTIASQPEHGLVALNGATVTYTPADGYSGADAFTYTATNPAGTTAAATVRLNVTTLAPTAGVASMTCDINSSATSDLRRFIKGSGLTGIAVTTLPTHGTVAVNGTQVTYTPNTDYFGRDAFAYVAFGNAGKSAPAVVNVTVIGRPDPTKDANVTGLMDAQAQSAKRFSSAQVSNFTRRMESLHRIAPNSAPATEDRKAPAASAAVPARADAAVPMDGGSATASVAGGPTASASRSPVAGLLNLIAPAMSTATTRTLDLNGASAGGGGNEGWYSGFTAWVGGTAQFGRRDAKGDIAGLEFTTDGLSVGLDRRVSQALVLGLGIGYGRDDTDVGTQGSRSKAKGQSFALYGSFQPSASTFIDVLLGMGSLDFDTRRYVAAIDQLATGKRKGDQAFASISGGLELRRDNILLSPYGRIDLTQDKLKAYADGEVGDYALAYDAMKVKSTQFAAGLRYESQHDADFGSVIPRARVEYRREFQDDARGTLRYLDLVDGPQYSVTTTGVSRNALMLGVGSDFVFRGGLKVGIDYSAQRASGASNVQAVRILVSQDLDGRGSPFSWQPTMLKNSVNIEAGYTYDDNVSRGRVDAEKRSDSIFSLSVGQPIPFKLGSLTNVRLVLTPSFSGEKLRTWSGLGRFSAGAQGEVQYRSSGAFDAVTLALVGRAAYDQYESEIRRGGKYFLGFNARRSMTDRIDLFAEAGRQMRDGKSEVFQTKEWLGKLNLDYSLGRRGVLYFSGEYRKGDIVSSGLASLANVGLADVFVPDDAFDGLFAYRFDGHTVLGTVGWNYPLGPRDSLDFSWRRVESKPSGHTMWDSGTLRYIDNQYSLVYLMRF